MLVISALALLLVVAEWLGLLSSATLPTPRWHPRVWIIALILSYAGQLAVVTYAAVHQTPMPLWRLSMPLPVIDDRGPVTDHADLPSAIVLILGALQAYALLAIYRNAPRRPHVIGGALALLVLSIGAPALTSGDLYSNAGYGMLGWVAYAPPAHAFPAGFESIERWWGSPMVAAPYGPLWLRVDGLITGPFGTLIAKMYALRAFGAACFIALACAVAGLGVPQRVLAVLLLNPAIAMQYVANAHNDIFALALLAAAAVAARRRSVLLAVLLVTIAALVKLPYAVLGLPVLAAVRPGVSRGIAVACALAAAGVLSWLWGGAAYLHALVAHAQSAPQNPIARVGAVAAVALVALALVRARRLRTAAWILPQTGAYAFAWYYLWGLPYALLRRRALSYLLVCFPLVSVVTDSAFSRIWELAIVAPVLALLSLLPRKAPA